MSSLSYLHDSSGIRSAERVKGFGPRCTCNDSCNSAAIAKVADELVRLPLPPKLSYRTDGSQPLTPSVDRCEEHIDAMSSQLSSYLPPSDGLLPKWLLFVRSQPPHHN